MLDIIIVVIILAVLFEISNGWNDSANAIATVVSTRVLTPLQAVILAAVMNMLGALVSTSVAKTIGTGIVTPTAITEIVVASIWTLPLKSDTLIIRFSPSTELGK